MNSIISIAPDNHIAIVEPGVLNQELQDVSGRFFFGRLNNPAQRIVVSVAIQP